MGKTSNLNIRISTNLKEQLESQSQDLGVPLSKYVRLVLISHVDRSKDLPEKTASKKEDQLYAEALLNKDKNIVIKDINEFFDSL